MRVFISSTLGELAEERLAARAAVEQLRLTPILFELGARAHPPRALYRSYLAQSDVFVGVYWQRYGWVAPDMDISGLEDEFVLSEGMPRLIYVKRPAPEMEPRLKDMLSRLEGEDSVSYKPFRDGAELRELLLDDLAVLLTERFEAARADSSTGSSATNLPALTSTFLGREAALASLNSLLAAPDARLVTLTGPGGTGKTRLAIEAARAQVSRFNDGVFFVDLSQERDPGAAFAVVARTLEITGLTEVSIFDALIRHLRKREMLLLLDNFEQVTSAAPGVVALLEQCPSLKVLVTSRQALGVRGERIFPVPPLAQPAAERLFVERASAAVPDFALADGDDADVAAICKRLDGLPLAVELAAARVKLFSLAELREELEQRLDVLKLGARDLPARQQTLRRAIEWSDELLTDEERTVFRLLSVFTDPRLPDVQAAWARVPELSEIDVIDGIGSLVDKSLVAVSPGADRRPRFSMLHVIREYAVEQLAAIPDLAAAVRRAHAEQYCEVATRLHDRLTFIDRGPVLAVLHDELGNLRAAWEYWADERDLPRLHDLLGILWGYYEATGDYRAVVELGQDLLRTLSLLPETPERRDDEFALQMNLARTHLAVRGFTPDAEAEISAALSRADETDDLRHRFPTLRTLASLHLMRADFEKMGTASAELMEIAEKQGEPAMLSEAHLLAGLRGLWMEHLSVAIAHADEAVVHFRASTSGFVEFRVGPNPGVVATIVSALLRWMAGLPDGAAARMKEALALAEQLDHPYSTAYALHHAALLDLWRLDPVPAMKRSTELRRIAATYGYPIWHALALVLHGTATVATGDAKVGVAEVDEGFSLYKDLSTPPVFWPALLMMRAGVCLMTGDVEAGLGCVGEAEECLNADDPLQADLAIMRADLVLASHEPDVKKAEQLYEHAAALAAGRGARMIELQALTRLAVVRTKAATPGAGDTLRRLRTLYDTFTEGFTTTQLSSARAVLHDEK